MSFMSIASIKNMFSKKENIQGIPTIDSILDEAESKIAKGNAPKNIIPSRLMKFKNGLGKLPELDGRRYVSIDDVEKMSPLLAHEIKRTILAELVENGFNVYNYNGFKIRYGKKISYDYYYLNLRPQSNIEDKKTVLVQDSPVKTKSPETAEIDFASIVTIHGEDVVIYYSLILGVTGLEDVSL